MTLQCEVRDGASDGNAGFFDPALGGTDYTQQTGAQATGTVSSSGTTVTATTSIFTSVMVGNYITDGTTYRKITAYTSATVVTVNSAPSWTAASIKVGGALATPGWAAYLNTNQINSGGITEIYLKYFAGTYDITTATKGPAGPVFLSNYDSSTNARLIGYDSTRTPFNLDANRPTIKATVTLPSDGIVGFADRYAAGGGIHNIIADMNSQAAGHCFYDFGYLGPAPWRCIAKSATGSGYAGFQTTQPVYCHADGCLTGFSATNSYGVGLPPHACLATNCTKGFYCENVAPTFSIAHACTTGFSLYGGRPVNCIAVNGTNGFQDDGYNAKGAINCIAAYNSGRGFFDQGYRANSYKLVNCAGYANGSGNQNMGDTSLFGNYGFLDLTAGPFVNYAATINNLEDAIAAFALNNDAGGGADCRASGIIPFLDRGAFQHQDAGGGGGGSPRFGVSGSGPSFRGLAD